MDAAAIKAIFDQSLAEFKESQSQQPPFILQAAVPKPVILQSKGNQNQLDHQETLLKLVTDAKTCIVADPEQSIKFLDSAVEKINHRINLIKLADSSEAGWAAVNEYEQISIADDSDDDKRMRKADKSALLKRKKRSSASRAKPARSQVARPPYPTFPTLGTSRRGTFFRSLPQRDSVCFGCGLPGHFRNACPKSSAGYSGKPAYSAGRSA